ncbi:MAG: acetyl/propionyl/methylcrotonyl-CoA carboxylase subunit alpha [Betaproteobacteria bacterium]|nr:MAG: acetyl/propionyl/methylcrotonyl-CoA carboxylase subunit alpha [Betaproteobacteria bacterium]
MFKKILIANRGEIACRVILTAQRLGVKCVAVYSEADAGARHVALADEAYCIGPAAAKDSYLRGDKILKVAKDSRAEGVHPGYGFLSENADFAEACEKAGVVFIGPPPAAIRAMGSKSAAKFIMGKAGVPLVPGYHGEAQGVALLKREADKIGYPVLIKASAGGGGKGMRIVDKAADFAAALASCQRESKASFGDERVLLEKYLTRPRHIEIQVFADTRGEALYLFERDCSVQRRHQKVLEEAPAPGMSRTRRGSMGEAAVAAARAIGYVGAGTVEFIAEPGKGKSAGTFYFMEMNTRLQVEHPVTEMITGLDLVEWQLRVACGEPLPRTQDQLAINGHAVEARIYAEDPAKNFLPSTGRITHLATPAESRHVRIDTGVRAGDAITPFYDPMIAKLIVWDSDRPAALSRMRAALEQFQVVGVTTNTEFLARLIACDAFAAADLDTGLIERNRAQLLPEPPLAGDEVLALAALAELLAIERRAKERAAASGDPCSPWGACDGWRLNQDNHHILVFRQGEHEQAVTAHYRGEHFELELPGGRHSLSGAWQQDGSLTAWLEDAVLRANVVRTGSSLDIFFRGTRYRLELRDPSLHEIETDAHGGNLAAPMPGKVIAVLTKRGAKVDKGTPLIILEAMKMEHTIVAPGKGTVTEIHFKVGEQVGEGEELLGFELDA